MPENSRPGRGPVRPENRVRLPWPTPGVQASRVLAAVGAAWSALFAAAHFYWAAGGRAGVSDVADTIADRPLFLAYDVAAGVVFAAASTCTHK